MIRDQAEISGARPTIDAAGGVAENEGVGAEQAGKAHGEDHLRRREALIGVKPAAVVEDRRRGLSQQLVGQRMACDSPRLERQHLAEIERAGQRLAEPHAETRAGDHCDLGPGQSPAVPFGDRFRQLAGKRHP